MGQNKVIFLLILITLFSTGMVIWPTENYIPQKEISILTSISFFLPVAYQMVTRLNFKGIFIASVIGVIISIMIKLFLNNPFDGPVYNLTTSNIILEILFALFATLIGSSLGYFVKRYQERHSKYK